MEALNKYEVYAQIPPELYPKGHKKIVVRLIKSLYGEKQAAYEWHQRLKQILCELMEFEQLIYDECIFVKKDEQSLIHIMITVHVDDILICAKTNEMIEEFKRNFRSHVTEVKEYSDFKKYLGLEIEKNENSQELYLSQRTYVKDILEKYLIKEPNNRSRKVPIMSKSVFENVEDEDETTVNLLPIIGKLRYLADCTYPQILAALGMVSSRGSNANQSYCKAMLEIIYYINSHINSRLKVGSSELFFEIILFMFVDASFMNANDGTNRFGGTGFLGYETGSFYNYSKVDRSVIHFPSEAEVKHFDNNIRLLTIYRKLLEELGHKQKHPTKVYTDSLSMCELFKQYQSSKRLRHISRCINNTRIMIETKQMELVYIPRKYNCADIHTRLTPKKEFEYATERILNGYSKKELMEMEAEGWRIRNGRP